MPAIMPIIMRSQRFCGITECFIKVACCFHADVYYSRDKCKSFDGEYKMAAEKTPSVDTGAFGLPDIENIDTDAVLGFLTVHGMKLLVALAIFVIGKWVVKRIVAILRKMMSRAKVDPTLVGFLGNIIFGIGMAFVVVAALSQMGIETTSLAAAIGAAGLAVGLALQGSLANFAAGVLIILFRPFKSGDYVEVAGIGGTVEEISIFTTQMATPDNKCIIIPNGNITSGTIVNYSAKPVRRIDLVIGVAYDADLPTAKGILEKVIAEDERVLKNPEPKVAVLELADSAVNFVVRPWVKSSDYWDVYFDVMQKIKIDLDKAGIGIPFPQRDVHLFVNEGQTDTVKKAASRSAKKTA